MRRATEAKTSLEEFYRFVMRHELTQQPLEPAPHQRLMFGFVEHHDRCVLRLPIGCGKTYSMAAVTLWLLGQDPTQRGAIVSKTRFQAAKVLGMVSAYISDPTLSERLAIVFPGLRPAMRQNTPWTQSQITVDRPAGIRDPSLIAVGFDSAVGGARLSWIVADDVIDDENSYAESARERVNNLFGGRILSRLDPTGSRAVVPNTPWHKADLTFHLEALGWPSITMDVYGNIRWSNADPAWVAQAEQRHVRPSVKRLGSWRLRAHDPDPDEEVPLWPARYSAPLIAQIRTKMLPHEFARLMLCEPFDEGSARCHREWIERCKRAGKGMTLVDQYDGPNPTFTGVDLAIGTGREHDLTAFFTFELLPDRRRRLLDVEGGHWDGKTVVRKLIDKHDRYGSIIAVESNQGQDFIRQWAMNERKDLIVKSHVTTRVNRRHVDFGIESLFTEIQNAAWIIPCDEVGNCAPPVQAWIDNMLFYQPPPAHVGDYLIASWIAREVARGRSFRDPRPKVGRMIEALRTGGF